MVHSCEVGAFGKKSYQLETCCCQCHDSWLPTATEPHRSTIKSKPNETNCFVISTPAGRLMKALWIPDILGLWPCASTSGTSFPETGLWIISWAPWSAAAEPSSSSQRTLSSLTGAATSWTSPTSGFSMGIPAETQPSWSCWNRCPRTTSPNASANCENSWAPPPTWSGLRRRRRSRGSGGVSAMLWE